MSEESDGEDTHLGGDMSEEGCQKEWMKGDLEGNVTGAPDPWWGSGKPTLKGRYQC